MGAAVRSGRSVGRRSVGISARRVAPRAEPRCRLSCVKPSVVRHEMRRSEPKEGQLWLTTALSDWPVGGRYSRHCRPPPKASQGGRWSTGGPQWTEYTHVRRPSSAAAQDAVWTTTPKPRARRCGKLARALGSPANSLRSTPSSLQARHSSTTQRSRCAAGRHGRGCTMARRAALSSLHRRRKKIGRSSSRLAAKALHPSSSGASAATAALQLVGRVRATR